MMRDGALRATSIFGLFFNLIGSLGFVVLIPYFKGAFAASDVSVGLAFGCFSAGAALGSYVAGRSHWQVGRALIIANVIDGVAWLALPWVSSVSLEAAT